MKRLSIFLVLLGVSVSVFAEVRVWTDKKGNTLEAELAGTEGKKIVLKKQDGSTLTISPVSLSDDDKEYLHGKVSADLFDPSKDVLDLEKPPRLEISFKKITDTDNNMTASSYRIIDMYSSVTITKKNPEPYSGQMKVEVYVIGFNESENLFALLDKATHDFSVDERRKEITFETDHITLREYRYDTNYSTEYKGHLVVVLDEDGKALAMKSSSKKFEENYKSLAKFRKGTFFNKRYTAERSQTPGRYW